MDFETPLPSQNVRPLAESVRLAIMMPTWVGDACMATPTLRAIRARYPNCKITMISRPVICEVVSGAWGNDMPWFDDCLPVSKKGGAGVHTRLSLTKALRAAGIASAVLLSNSFWSAAAMRLAGVRRVIGYQRDARGWLLSDRVPVPQVARKPKPISAVDYYLELARWIGCDITDRRMQLHVSEQERLLALRLYDQLGLDPHAPTLVVNSNSATDIDRLWPEERVQELCQRLVRDMGLQVLLHCGPQEREQANRISTRINLPQVASMGVCDDLPIALSRAVLATAAAVVSTDSGPRHIAVALNRRVVTLYGPTSPAWTTTYNCPEVPVQHAVDGVAAMRHITVDEVLMSVQRALAQSVHARPLAA